MDNTFDYLKPARILVTLGLYCEQDLSRPPTKPPADHAAVKLVKERTIMDCLTGEELKLSGFRLNGEDINDDNALTLGQIYEQTGGGIPTYLVAYIEAVW